MLSEKLLLLAHDTAVRIMRDKPKPRDMNQQAWVAKVWEEALLASLKKAGYEVCLKQPDS